MEKYSLIKKFSENCAAHPNDTAIIDVRTGSEMSYRELDECSGRVYRYLTEHGIGREDVVMIHLPRGAKPFVTIVGVWKAGAAYVILETDYPAEKREFIRRDANCKLIIDDNIFEEMMKCEPLEGCKAADPHDLSYIIYTSGTTGNPKGCMHEYGTLGMDIATWQYGGRELFERSDNFIQLTPLNFTATVILFHAVIHAGATLTIVPLETVKNINCLSAAMDENGITAGFFTPSLFRLLPKLPDRMAKVFVGGEKADEISGEGAAVYNMYASSESGMVLLTYRVEGKTENVPLGKPNIEEACVCLLDREGNAVIDGEAGELCFKNPYFRGYVGLPDKNAAVFRNGYIRSGDLLKILSDGNYQFLGRTDDMVKVNGNRVEPAEIEAAVKKVLGTEWVGVRVFTEGKNNFVCAYYTGEPVLPMEEAKEIIREKLVPYMQPAFYIKIDEMPISPNGKFKRNALPKPVFSDYQKGYVEPSTEFEKKLCNAFASVLGLERVGATDDFYEIGGDSMNAIMLVALVDTEAFDTGMIFDGRTPKEIARLYEKAAEKGIESIELRNEKAMKADHALSDEQFFMLDYQLRYPKSTAWNISLLLKFGSDTDMERLKKAVDSALKAHPVFSIRYVFDENTQLVQKYNPDMVFDTPIEVISEADFVDESEDLVQPFNLLNEPMYRVRIFKTERGGYLFLDLHHSIADGTSIHILVRDISKVYSGEPLERDYYFVSFEDREEKKKSHLFEEARDYYETLLGGQDWDTCLKTDTETDRNTYGNMSVMIPIDELSYKKLNDMYDIGKNAFYIATAALAIAVYNGSENIRVSWVYSGRQTASDKNVIGALLRGLYVGIRFGENKTLKELFDDVKTQVDKNIYYSFYPYPGPEHFSEDCDDASIIYQADLRSIAANGMLDFTIVEIPYKTDCADNLLDIEIHNTDEGCKLYMDYNACAYKEESIYRFRKLFLKTACLLMENLDNPEMEVADIMRRVRGT